MDVNNRTILPQSKDQLAKYSVLTCRHEIQEFI